MLSSIPRSMLDSLAVTLLNKNQALIATKLTTAAHEHGLELKIDQMSFSP